MNKASRTLLPPIYEEIYNKDLVHGVMEAEKFQDLQLANWKFRRVDGVTSSPSPSSKAEDQCPSSKTREQILPCTAFFLYSGPQQIA